MTTTMSLYNISGRFYELMARAAADETLNETELAEQQTELAGLLKSKTSGIIGYYRNVESSIVAVDAEIKRLNDLKQRMSKHRDNYKEYVKTCMERMDIIEISTDIGKLKIAKNPVSVEITDANSVPEEYVTATLTIKGDRCKIDELMGLSERYIELLELKTTYELTADKRAIADNFKQTGEIVTGATVHVANTRLDIK